MHGTGFDQAFHHSILDDNKERMYQIIKACLRFNVQSTRYLKFKVPDQNSMSQVLTRNHIKREVTTGSNTSHNMFLS
jgi:hypothetical protein